MSQPLDLVCPHCAQRLKVAGATSGRQVRCPKCHGFVRVPEPTPPPDREPARWMVRTEDGRHYGPVSRTELEHWVNEGRVSAHCHVAPEGTEQWVWAAEMFSQLAQPPRGAPAPASYTQPYYPPGSYQAGPVSDKSRLVAGLLGLLLPLLGLNGVHRLYTGHIGLGILMLITCGGCGVWQLIDVILVFAGSVTDADGRPLRD